ncbi:MAG: DUF885 domain-containing protein [Gemmataceae bacterium]|nr:DUF885 domain-containing protein [Gemmataceae bacterium]MDW8267271.1 DUF885 domain-containing protein [Gemmataceae bacterium]
MRYRLSAIAVALSLGPWLTAAEDESSRLTAFFRAYLDEEFRLRPFEATQLGDHRFDDQLDDLSPEAQARWLELQRRTLRQLPEQVNYHRLPRPDQIDFEIFAHHLRRNIWLAENTRRFQEDPRVYNEYISDSIFLLLTQSTQPKAVTIRNCVARMARIPAVVAAARVNLRQPPRVFVETALRQNRGAIAFYQSGIFEVAGETPQLSDLAEPARQLVPVLKDYQEFLEKELLPQATGNWRLGKEKFERKLELELDAGLTADEVLREAEAEASRVERDMYVIARQLWGTTFPKRPLPPDDPEGRSETIRQVLAALARDHGRVEDLIADARATVANLKRFITQADILRLPEPDRCRVIEMPEFQRGNAMAYLNPAPPLDPKAESIYAISPPPREWDARRVTSFLEEYNRHMLPILTIHEAYPGHYVQLEYSNRHPSLIRRVLASGVFAEGWAVYTEQMMLDQGYGRGDLALRLHQLKFYLRAVLNAILDHHMHCTTMSDDEAYRLLTQRGFQSDGEATAKIVRAKQSSCQLSTYFVGRTAFYRLRQQMQRALGDRFDLGRYHEAVLDHGTVPVKYLPELVADRLKRPR